MPPSTRRELALCTLRRVGFFDALAAQTGREAAVESCSAIAHRETNTPRLEELRYQYRTWNCDAYNHSQWSGTYAFDGIDIRSFRKESSYLWDLRDGNVPLTYAATYYYHRSSINNDLLQLCEEDRAFGVYALSIDGSVVTRDRLDSVAEIGFLRRMLGWSSSYDGTILDIGSGYGRLAWRISQCFPSSFVVCVDAVPESAFLCEFYLAHRGIASNGRMVPLPSIGDDLTVRKIDVAIAVNSLSECSLIAIRWWLALLADLKVPHLMLVPHAVFSGGQRLLSTESDSSNRADLLPVIRSYGYYKHRMFTKYEDSKIQLYGISPTTYH